VDEKPDVGSSDVTPDEPAESAAARDLDSGTTPDDSTPVWRDDPDEVLASIRRLRRLEHEKSRIPAGTSRFDAIVRTLDEAARELFRRAAGAVDGSRGAEPGDGNWQTNTRRADETAHDREEEAASAARDERSDGPGT